MTCVACYYDPSVPCATARDRHQRPFLTRREGPYHGTSNANGQSVHHGTLLENTTWSKGGHAKGRQSS
jgi:hypothetical protein